MLTFDYTIEYIRYGSVKKMAQAAVESARNTCGKDGKAEGPQVVMGSVTFPIRWDISFL